MRLTQGWWVPSDPAPDAILIDLGWVDAENRWIYASTAYGSVQSPIYSMDTDKKWYVLMTSDEKGTAPENRMPDVEFVNPVDAITTADETRVIKWIERKTVVGNAYDDHDLMELLQDDEALVARYMAELEGDHHADLRDDDPPPGVGR